jgi:hypothetical protein
MNALQRIILVLGAVAIVVAYFAAPWVYEHSNRPAQTVEVRNIANLKASDDTAAVYRDYRVFLPEMLAICAVTAMLYAAARGVLQSRA